MTIYLLSPKIFLRLLLIYIHTYLIYIWHIVIYIWHIVYVHRPQVIEFIYDKGSYESIVYLVFCAIRALNAKIGR